jgi:hypothetical protein
MHDGPPEKAKSTKAHGAKPPWGRAHHVQESADPPKIPAYWIHRVMEHPLVHTKVYVELSLTIDLEGIEDR